METEIYGKMYANEDKFWWYLGMRKIIVSLLDKHLSRKNNLKILDVGCGTGGMFSTLSRYGQVYGIDKSERALGYARTRNIAQEIKQGEADKLPWPDDAFDLVGCFDVLYHQWIEDDAKVLKEIYRVLVPGGMIIVREASYNWLRSQHDQLVLTNHRFTRNELVNKLQQAGFKVKKSSYANFFLFPLALVKRLLEKIAPEKDPMKNIFSHNSLANAVLTVFLYIEAEMIKYLNFPFGLSVICVAKK